MPPAVAIAGIGAAAGIGGAVLSSKATKSAAKSASQTAADTTATNNALARDIYQKNQQILSPYSDRGNSAGNAINSLLGLGVAPPQEQPQQQNFYPFGYGNAFYQPYSYQPQQATQPVEPTTTQQDYENAFQNYRDSTGYQFRQQEGNNALNTGYAANGALRSGAAQKAFADYNQNISSSEFGNYLGQLANQQGVGLSAASAVAGVGQNYVNNVTANNNSAGTVAANAALASGQANANLYGQLGNAFGTFASSFGS